MRNPHKIARAIRGIRFKAKDAVAALQGFKTESKVESQLNAQKILQAEAKAEKAKLIT